MTDKRPSEMTDDEREALPIGPFEREFVPYTEADYARGAVGRGRVRVIYHATEMIAWRPDEPIAWIDRQGRGWTFGRWVDGRWYKSAAMF